MSGPAAPRGPGPAPPGPVLFARYAYPPNALGYCGPADHAALLQAGAEASTPGAPADLAHLARQFEGAWPYLQLIAACNGIGDPLDRRVVEAYWVGNELTARVPGAALTASVDDRFGRRAGRRFALVAAAAAAGVPQHAFHVFAVSPWVGLLRAGTAAPALEVLDRCRVRWGRVQAVSGDLVTVTSRPLASVGGRLVLGEPRPEVARRSLGGVGFATDLAAGDTVSLHWDWVCDRLSPHAARWLRACTGHALDAVNALPAPGPAEVCDR